MESAQGVVQPPSPLTGCYLLIVVGEPYSKQHKDIILQRIAKGLLSWDVKDCLVDLEKELAIITEQALEGEEARYGERLIQYASENLVTEILIHPAVSTLAQCMRNLLSSFTRHRHIIHAGYTFAANGSWALQDGTFSLADFSEAFQEPDVQRVLHAYERGISLDVHCSPEGEWPRLPKEPFARACRARLNPGDLLASGSADIGRFVDYLAAFLRPVTLDTLLASSDVVGNIRFSRPTLYIFPGGQGDAALFGINGFNMLLDGGFSRKACFWDFVRHLDRLDAVLLTRLNNSNVGGISSILRRKKQDVMYPQIGHFFCNIQERRTLPSPDGDKDKDPLLINLLEEGQEIISNLRHMNLHPQTCYRDSDPINLYHKVGHGTLDMYVLSPGRDSREVKEFLQKWNQCDQKLFANVGVKSSREFNFPIQNLVSIAALLVWQPANAEDTITRILFPGSSPQNKIFEGLDRLRNLECIKHATCSGKSLQPVTVGKKAIIDKVLPKSKSQAKEHKTIENNIINGMDGDVKEKGVKKSDSTESDRSSKAKKIEESKVIENGDKPKPKSKPKVIGESQPKKKQPEKKASPTTPKKTEGTEAKKPSKPSPLGTPAKSAKDANNRKVVESKVKREISTKPTPPKPKAEKKPIQRKPAAKKAPMSPAKKLVNGVQKPDSISKKGKLDKEGTADSSTVSTPSADQESVLKKDLTKLSQEDIQKLKAQELADLKEEQEAIKEIEAVFRKGEVRPVKAPAATIDDKLEKEEYIIIEKEVIEQEPESKEDETQKLARDSEESEKQRRHSSEQINIVDETPLKIKEMLSPEDKQDVSSEKKTTDKDIEEEIKDVVESHPDEKVSANIKSGDTTTAPTLPEDERIPIDEMTPLDEIKEDNGQVIEEKHVKEETKEKGVPVIQLPPKTFDTSPKIPSVVGIRLNKQQHMRDIVKTPDEVADLPVHEEVDYEYTHELKIDAAAKSNEVAETKLDQHPPGVANKEQQKEVEHEKDNDEAKESSYVQREMKNLEETILQNESILQKDILTESERKAVDAEKIIESEGLGGAKIGLALEEQGRSEVEMIEDIMKHRKEHPGFGETETLGHKEEKPRDDDRGHSPDETKRVSNEQNIGGKPETNVEREDVEKHQETVPESDMKVGDIQQIIIEQKYEKDKPMSNDEGKHAVEKTDVTVGKDDIRKHEEISPGAGKVVEDKQKFITEQDHKEDKPSDEEVEHLDEHSRDGIKEGFTTDNIIEKTEITVDEDRMKREDKLPESDKIVEYKKDIIDEQKHKEDRPGINEEEKHFDSHSPDASKKNSTEENIIGKVEAPVAKEDVIKHGYTIPDSDKIVRDTIVEKSEVTLEKEDIMKHVDEPSDEKDKHLNRHSPDVFKKDSTEDTFVDKATVQGGTIMKHEEKTPKSDQIEQKGDSITEQKHKEYIPSDEKYEYHDRQSPKATVKESSVTEIAESTKVTVEEDNIIKHGAKLLEAEKTSGGSIEKVHEGDKSKSDADAEHTGAIERDSEKIIIFDKNVSEVDEDTQKEKEQLISQTNTGKEKEEDVASEFNEETPKAPAEFDHDVKDKKVDSVHVEETMKQIETNFEKQLEVHHTEKEESVTYKDIGETEMGETESNLDDNVLKETKEFSHENMEDEKDTRESDKDSVKSASEGKIKEDVNTKLKEHEMTMATDSTDIEEVDMVMRNDVKGGVVTDKMRDIPKIHQRDTEDTITSMSERKKSSQLDEIDDETLLDQEIIAADLKPHVPSDPTEKIDLGRKSPKEREEDVIKIVASVAEVLKSDAPLEEFEGKLPISTFKSYTTELRETHITTVGSPVIETKVIRTDIPTIPEEPYTACASFLEGERRAISTQDSERAIEDKKINLLRESQEFMMATSKMLSDIKSTTAKQTKQSEDTPVGIEQVVEDKVEDESVSTVQRMLVTASSEDGGEEIEICPAGSIIFSKSSESSGRSSPDPSQKTPKSSIVDTSESLSTVRQILTDQTQQDEGIDDVDDVEDFESKSISPRSPSQETDRGPSIAKDDMGKPQKVESDDLNQISQEEKTSESKPSDLPKVGVVMLDSSKGSEPIILKDATATTKHTKEIDVSIKDSQVTGLPVKDDTEKRVCDEASVDGVDKTEDVVPIAKTEVSSMISRDDVIKSDGLASGHEAKEDEESQDIIRSSQEKVHTHQEISPSHTENDLSQQQDDEKQRIGLTEREKLTHMTDGLDSSPPSHNIEEVPVTEARKDIRETAAPPSGITDENVQKDDHYTSNWKDGKQHVELDYVRDEENDISSRHATSKIPESEDIEATESVSKLYTEREECFGFGTPPKEQEMIDTADREYELMKDIENEFFDDSDLLLNRRIPLEIDISKTQKLQHIDIDNKDNIDKERVKLDEKIIEIKDKQADTQCGSSLDEEKNEITSSAVIEEPIINTEGRMLSEAATIKDGTGVIPKTEVLIGESSQKSKLDSHSDSEKTASIENMHDAVIGNASESKISTRDISEDVTKAIDHDEKTREHNKTDFEKLQESAIDFATKMHTYIVDEVVEVKKKSGDIIDEFDKYVEKSTKSATEASEKTTDVIATVNDKLEEGKQSIDDLKGTAASLLESAADKLSIDAAEALNTSVDVINGIKESIEKTVKSEDEIVPEINSVEDALKEKLDHEKTLLEDISEAAIESIDALGDVAKSITAGISGLFGKTEDAVEEKSEKIADIVSSGIETSDNVQKALEKDSGDEIIRISKAVTDEVQQVLGAVTPVTELKDSEEIKQSQQIEQNEKVCKDGEKKTIEGISIGIEASSDARDSISSKAEKILDDVKSTTIEVLNGTKEELSAAATKTNIEIDSSKGEAGTSVPGGSHKKPNGEQASLKKESDIIASSDAEKPKTHDGGGHQLTSSTSATVDSKSSTLSNGDEKLSSKVEIVDEKALEKEVVLKESAKDLEDTFEILTDMNKTVVFETYEKKNSDKECKDSSEQYSKEEQLVDSAQDIEETLETVAQLSKSLSFEKCEKEPIAVLENDSTKVTVESSIDDRGDEVSNKIEHQVSKNIEEQLGKDVTDIGETYEKVAQMSESMSFEKCGKVDVQGTKDKKEVTDSELRPGEFSQKIETSMGTLKSLGKILEDRVSETSERISDKLPTGVPKELEEQLEDNVKNIGETYEHVAELSKSLSFDKCEKVDTKVMVERMIEESAEDIGETFGIVDDMSKSVIFETCHTEREHKDQSDTLNQVHRDSIPSGSGNAEDMVKSYESEKGERETMEKSTNKIEHVEKETDKTEELVSGWRQLPTSEPVDISTKEETEYRKLSSSGGIEEKAIEVSQHDDTEHLLGKDKKDELDELDITSRRISDVSKEMSEKFSKGIENDKTDHLLEEDRLKTDSSKQTVSERTLEKSIEETEHKKTNPTVGNGIKDELEVEKTECRKLSVSEVDESLTDRNGATDANIAADYLHHYEKHIADVITPPTVPVSPIVMEEIKFTSRTDALIKEVGLRSVTPGSDDSEFASSHASEQVSRIEMPSHPLDKDSNEEDLLSVASQAVHSREEEPKKPDIDPMSMSFYGSLPEDSSFEGHGKRTHLYEITQAKYTGLHEDEPQDERARCDVMSSSFMGELPTSSSGSDRKDPIEAWGKPLGLPKPEKESHEQTDMMTASFYGELPSDSADPIASWGKPLGLPSPAPPTTNDNNNKGTPKKERPKVPPYVSAKNKLNADERRRAESPSKRQQRNAASPVYVDLTYAPHHGNAYYANVDFFKRVRARYYVFSGLEPGREVYDALLEAKQTWEDKDLEVTIIPTYDTDILGYWVAENEEILTKLKIDLSPSASRCTINLQDHETSCSAYRLEF